MWVSQVSPLSTFNYDRSLYLCCYELFQPLNSHSSPQDSSDGGETRVIPGERDEKKQETNMSVKVRKVRQIAGGHQKVAEAKSPQTQ